MEEQIHLEDIRPHWQREERSKRCPWNEREDEFMSPEIIAQTPKYQILPVPYPRPAEYKTHNFPDYPTWSLEQDWTKEKPIWNGRQLRKEQTRLTREDVRQIFELFCDGAKTAEIADWFGIAEPYLKNILEGKIQHSRKIHAEFAHKLPEVERVKRQQNRNWGLTEEQVTRILTQIKAGKRIIDTSNLLGLPYHKVQAIYYNQVKHWHTLYHRIVTLGLPK